MTPEPKPTWKPTDAGDSIEGVVTYYGPADDETIRVDITTYSGDEFSLYMPISNDE